MADEVTLGEVVRRLDSITAQLAQIIAGQAQDRQHAAETFVRKDVLDPTLNAIRVDVTELQRDRDNQENRNRQLWLAVAGSAVTIVLTILAQALGFHVGS